MQSPLIKSGDCIHRTVPKVRLRTAAAGTAIRYDSRIGPTSRAIDLCLYNTAKPGGHIVGLRGKAAIETAPKTRDDKNSRTIRAAARAATALTQVFLTDCHPVVFTAGTEPPHTLTNSDRIGRKAVRIAGNDSADIPRRLFRSLSFQKPLFVSSPLSVTTPV